MRETLGQVVEKMTDAPDTGAIRTDLIAFLERVAALLRTTRGKAILRVVSAEHDNPVFANLVNSLLPHTDAIIPRAAIKRAVARGELPPKTDPKLVLFTLVGALIHRVLFEHGPMSSTYIEQLVDLVLFGAARKKARRLLGLATEQETLDRALDLIIAEEPILRAHRKAKGSGGVVDIFGDQ